MEIKDIFYINPHLKYRLDTEFTACYSELNQLMPEEALTLFYIRDAYCQFAGHAY